jgi:hypothetical protein
MGTQRLLDRLQAEQPGVRQAINWAKRTAKSYPPGVAFTVQVGAVTVSYWHDETGQFHQKTRR